MPKIKKITPALKGDFFLPDVRRGFFGLPSEPVPMKIGSSGQPEKSKRMNLNSFLNIIFLNLVTGY